MADTPGTMALALGGTGARDAAAARANLGAAAVGGLAGPDADFLIPSTAVHVAVPALTASRTWRLPDADAYPRGQDLVIADEGDSLSDAVVLTIATLSGSGDTIRGTSNNTATLRAPGAVVRFRASVTSNTWMIV